MIKMKDSGRLRRCVEYHLPRLDPIGFCLQRRVVSFFIPQNHRFLLLEPIQIAGGLVAGRVNGILLVNGPHRHAVVIIGGNVFGRTYRIGQRNFQIGHGNVVPGSWNNGAEIHPVFLFPTFSNTAKGGHCEENQRDNDV